MDMSIPEDVTAFLSELDEFIDTRIVPIQEANPEYFDHRREFSRTDVERGGIPTRRWREIMHEARVLADEAGFYRYPLPEELGGHEASVVANLPLALVLHAYGTPEQKEMYLDRLVSGDMEMAFGLTEPNHGSDATWLETRAVRDGDDWIITGEKRWNSVVDISEVDLVFARTGGEDGKAEGITAFLVPTAADGFEIPYYHWCFNMPTDHAEVHLKGVRVPGSAVVGEVGRGLDCAQLFVHENRIRQAASSLGAAQFCIDRSIAYTEERSLFGRKMRDYQGLQWQPVELQTEAELLRNTVVKTAWEMDVHGRTSVSDK